MKKYNGLRVIAKIYGILAIILLIIGIIAIIPIMVTVSGTDFNSNGQLIIVLISIAFYVFLNFISIKAIADLIMVMIDIEENTQKTTRLMQLLIKKMK